MVGTSNQSDPVAWPLIDGLVIFCHFSLVHKFPTLAQWHGFSGPQLSHGLKHPEIYMACKWYIHGIIMRETIRIYH